eukprot:GHVU01146151.1.p2 GENE.GHVU01146151.1~~GHVU01146151.1.p2  ORF type:complete len:116 (-),score=13.98 GHVU01146151.1:169-516(-)
MGMHYVEASSALLLATEGWLHIQLLPNYYAKQRIEREEPELLWARLGPLVQVGNRSDDRSMNSYAKSDPADTAQADARGCGDSSTGGARGTSGGATDLTPAAVVAAFRADVAEMD